MPGEMETPDILTLTSLNPIEQDGVLMSPRLDEKLRDYSHFEGAMWTVFMDTVPGELDEESKARKLAEYYQLKTAQKLQGSPRDEPLWMERFNQAGSELYGTIDPTEASTLAGQDLPEILQGSPDGIAAMAYQQLAGETTQVLETAEMPPEFEALKDVLFARFYKIKEVIDSLPEGPYEARVARQAIQKMVRQMATDDIDWLNWTVTNPEGKTMINVNPANREIQVPDGRRPIETKQELFGLSLHEIGDHAERSLNGYKRDDEMLAKDGLPGNIDFEEGLGVFFEYLVTGKTPEKANDRYVDIALATGAVNGIRLSREELIQLGMDREAARARARGKQLNATTALQSVVTHVNRIFRGGTGQAIRDEAGNIIDQAVFNKDLVYYRGFIKAKEFVLAKLQAGHSPESVLDFLLTGKFDATNDRHLDYLKNKYAIEL